MLVTEPTSGLHKAVGGTGPDEVGLVLVNRHNKIDDQPLLFPGWLLKERIRTTQHGSCIVGTTTELLSEATFGGQLQSQARDGDADIYPDLYNPKTDWMMESKSCKRSGKFLIELQQLQKYAEHGQVLYAFWKYDHPLPVGSKGNRSTIGEVIENVVRTITDVYVIDVRAVIAYRRLCGTPGVSFRRCTLRYRNRPTALRDYLTISFPAFERLRTDPETAFKVLGLAPSEWSVQTHRRRVKIRYNDVAFQTKVFNVHMVRDIIPF